jgi:hypothetical protein
MLGQHDEQSLVKVTCAHCKDTRLIAVAVATEAEAEAPVIEVRDEPVAELGAAISADEVLDARLTLSDFEGDLKGLLR